MALDSMHTNLENNEEFKNMMENLSAMLIDSSSIKDKVENFSGGNGYVKHDLNNVNDVTIKFLEFAHKMGYLGDKELMEKIKNYSNMPNFRQNSIVGRYLDGTPFYSFWYRLMCIDDVGREWGQVYFALNPDEAKNKECLNKHLRNESIDKLLK